METSFKSYVTQAEKDEKLAKAFKKVYERPETDIQERMLPGEITIGHAKKVMKYSACDDPTKGTCGTLICTNYRISFITSEPPTFDLVDLNNKMLGEEDVTLNNVDSLFVEYSNKRKRLTPKSRIKDGISRMYIHCKDFRVIAFNFKLTLKGEEQGVIKAILHHAYPTTVSLLFALDHKHQPNSSETCGIPLYRNCTQWEDLLEKFNLFETWRVASVNENYTCAETMGSYFIIPKSITGKYLKESVHQFTNNRLPMWCWTADNGCHLVRFSEIRPDSESGAETEKKFNSAIQNTDKKKRTFKIIDVAKTCPSCSQTQQSFTKLKSICTPGTEAEFWETDNHWFSSVHSSKWMHHVATMLSVAMEATEWLLNKEHHVVIKEHSGTDFSPILSCLVQLILDKDCRTLAGFQALLQREWVVAGHSFSDRLGHLVQPSKHGANSVLNTDHEANQLVAPLFFLFLDCVHQLTRQYPSAFQFSPVFLALLHDNTRNSAFDTFFFNNERQRQRTIRNSEQFQANSAFQTLPVWAWSLQYDESNLKLFNNPLYKIQKLSIPDKYFISVSSSPDPPEIVIPFNLHSSSVDSLDLIAEEEDPQPPGEVPGPLLDPDDAPVYYNSRTGVMVIGGGTPDDKKKRKFSMRRKKSKEHPGSEQEDGPSSSSSFPSSSATPGVSPGSFYRTRTLSTNRRPKLLSITEERLRPQCAVPWLKFWSSCYLRWIPWSQSFGGGPGAQFEQESILYDEIHHLYTRLRALEIQLDETTSNGTDFSSDDSGMYFSRTPSPGDARVPDTPSVIPSYFPYSPVRGLGRKSQIGSPIANFLRGGSIFNFKTPTRQPTNHNSKHTRSPSDLSFTTPSGDEGGSAAAAGGAMSSTSSSNSLDGGAHAQNNEEPKQQTTPTKGHFPKKALMPPKDRITYISSV